MLPSYLDPQALHIDFGGPVTGFAPDSKVTVENISAVFAEECGVDGIVTRYKLSDARIKVTLHLSQASATNARFSGRLNADKRGPNGAGVTNFELVDVITGSFVRGPAAWITGWPKGEWAKSPKPREWIIMIANGERSEQGS